MDINYPGDGCIWRFRRCSKKKTMNITGMLPEILCTLIIFILMLIYGIYATKARIRYMTYTNELRRHGKYAEWSNKNRIALFSENFSIYAFIVSFFGFMITGVLRLEDIAKFFFICFIVFSLSGVISSSILDRKIPKE